MLESILGILLSPEFYQATVRLTAPILLAAMGGLLAERAGVVTFSMEGMLLMGTVGGVIGSGLTNSVWGGLAGAILGGVLIAMLYAFMAVTVGANQIVTCVALNLGAIGLADTLYVMAFSSGAGGFVQNIVRVPRLPNWEIPLLGKIPVIGPVFFDHLPLVYLAYGMVPLVGYILYRTTWGLKARSVGEAPQAANALGISVRKVRYLTLLLAGVTSGLAGAFLSIGLLSSFTSNMTGGRGYIAYTAIVFGRWEPLGITLGALLFGSTDAFQMRMQAIGVPIPSQITVALPYIVTFIALVLFVKRAAQPAAYGQPWSREAK
jgi:ABC-type uncharacterized transport system permease subunit